MRGTRAPSSHEVTDRLGFTFPDQVTFVPLGFNKSFAPGDKDFDFVLQQISYAPERDEAVDFSESYYDVNQALVSTQGSPIDGGDHDRRTCGRRPSAPRSGRRA